MAMEEEGALQVHAGIFAVMHLIKPATIKIKVFLNLPILIVHWEATEMDQRQ